MVKSWMEGKQGSRQRTGAVVGGGGSALHGPDGERMAGPRLITSSLVARPRCEVLYDIYKRDGIRYSLGLT